MLKVNESTGRIALPFLMWADLGRGSGVEFEVSLDTQESREAESDTRSLKSFGEEGARGPQLGIGSI